MDTKLKKWFQESNFLGIIRNLKIMDRGSTTTTAETSKMEHRKGSSVFRYVKVNYPYSSRTQPNLYGPQKRSPNINSKNICSRRKLTLPLGKEVK